MFGSLTMLSAAAMTKRSASHLILLQDVPMIITNASRGSFTRDSIIIHMSVRSKKAGLARLSQ